MKDEQATPHTLVTSSHTSTSVGHHLLCHSNTTADIVVSERQSPRLRNHTLSPHLYLQVIRAILAYLISLDSHTQARSVSRVSCPC